MAEASESKQFPGDTEAQMSDSETTKGGLITLFFIDRKSVV